MNKLLYLPNFFFPSIVLSVFTGKKIQHFLHIYRCITLCFSASNFSLDGSKQNKSTKARVWTELAIYIKTPAVHFKPTRCLTWTTYRRTTNNNIEQVFSFKQQKSITIPELIPTKALANLTEVQLSRKLHEIRRRKGKAKL